MLTAVSIHLMLNHLPLLGSAIATGIFALGLLRRQEEILRLSLYLFIFSALAALPVYFSGEGAEEAVDGDRERLRVRRLHQRQRDDELIPRGDEGEHQRGHHAGSG